MTPTTPTEARILADRMTERGRTYVPEDCAAALRSLSDQVEALTADAERYRWLRDRLQVRYLEGLGTGEKRQGLVMRVGHGFLDSKIPPTSGWTDLSYFDDCRLQVDSAIDAAIKGATE